MIQAQRVRPASQAPSSIPANQVPHYLKDASHFQGNAEKVYFPRNEAEISFLLRQAQQTHTPLTISGAGTGLTGARVPLHGNVLSTKKLNRILKIEWDDRHRKGWVVVQPGVRLGALQKKLQSKGLFYPPNPGERLAFLGGNVATNASGSRSLLYGPTRRYVERLKILLANGELLDIPRGTFKTKQGQLTIQLANGKNLSIPVSGTLRKSVKSTAGYFLTPSMDLIDLFIGSEGTLGVVTEITLKIIPTPTGLVSGILFFPAEKEAFRFSVQAKKVLRPRALEFFDQESLKLLSQKHREIPSQARAALFFEQETNPKRTQPVKQAWVRLSTRHGALNKPWFSSNPHGEPLFREIRHDLPVLVNLQVERNGFRKLGTDFAVSDKKAEAMFDFYLTTLKDSGMPYVLFGHLGENHLHANLLPRNQQEWKRAVRTYGRLAQKAIALDGTISAEHGIGKIRIPYLEKMVGKKGMLAMARVKKTLDPAAILNPGNIIPVSLLGK